MERHHRANNGERASAADVRAWLVPIVDDDETLARRAALLRPQELHRARRFVFAADRARSITGRAALRVAAGRLLGCDPRDVPLATTSSGQLLIDAPGSSLHCSVSHSGELAAIALTGAGAVGVDIERDRRLDDVEQLAASVLSTEERAELSRSSPGGRVSMFLRYWTRKEAVSKAVGAGLAMPFERIVVSGDRTRAAVLDCEVAGPWTLATAYPRREYTAAVAVRACNASVEWLEWNESQWPPVDPVLPEERCRPLLERSSTRS